MTETPISAERAAKVLGVNRKTLLRMAAAGRLAGTWFVPTAEENGRKVFDDYPLHTNGGIRQYE
jgi:predicted site-specific integrase-resolvase